MSTVHSLQDFKQRVKKSEDRLRVWLFLNGYKVDETRIFIPHPDNMYPIKFLSDLVDSRLPNLIENPYDRTIVQGVMHDLGDNYLHELKQVLGDSSTISDSISQKIIHIIEKQENKGDLSSEGKNSIYFDLYYFLIKK